MDRQEHLSDGRIRYRYPTPIAAPYRLARIPRTAAVRLGHVLGTLDETVRFCAWVLTADYLAATSRLERDPAVEEALPGLEAPSTGRLLALIDRLVVSPALARPMVPELIQALRGEPGQTLRGLITDASAIRIERDALDLLQTGAWADALLPRTVSVLDSMAFLEQLLIVRPEAVGAEDPTTWYLHPWRGVGGNRPLVVYSAAGEHIGATRVLLVRPGYDVGLRLDPFLAPGEDDRLLGMLRAPGLGRITYEHYPSGTCVEHDVPLGRIMEERAQHFGYVPLGFDPASGQRVADEANQRRIDLLGYRDAIATAVSANGKHFRAISNESGQLHSVVRIHRHLVRDAEYLRHVVASAQALARVDHPNVAAPIYSRFDPESGCFVVGTDQAMHGRLIDRLPPGFQLPIGWALRTADSILAGLDALAEREIYLSALPGWAISLTEQVQVVPFLAGTHGRVQDAAGFVALLLYRMLCGEDPTEINPLAPSVLRKGVPETVDQVVLQALTAGYETPLAMRAALRAAGEGLEDADGESIRSVAVHRTFSHLQRLRPGALETLDAATRTHEASGDPEAMMASLHRTIDALWDPDERLARFVRLVEVAGSQGDGRDGMLEIYQRIIDIAGDHLPTLHFAAATYSDAIRASDRKRLYRRILHAAHSEEEVCSALEDMAALCEERRELEEALEYWQRLVELRADRAAAWRGLTRLRRVLGDEEGLAQALERLLELTTEPDERLDLVGELAVLRAGALGDLRGAAQLMHEVVAHAKSGPGAWEVMRDIARETHDDELLVQALAGLAARTDISPEERYAAQLERATALGLRCGDPTAAVAILDDVLKSRQSDRPALSYRALILERAGQWLETAAALEAWAAVEEEPRALALALRRLAALSDRHLGEPERAMTLYEGVLETEPGDREALQYLAKAYEQGEDWASLAPVLQSLVESASSREELIERLERLATIEDELLGDSAAAFHSYKQLLTLAPRNPARLARFVELADATGGWDEAGDVVEIVLPHLDPETARGWRNRLGKMRLDHTEDVASVLEFFRNAVQEDPDDVTALEGLAGATERMAAWDEHADALRRLAEMADISAARITRLTALAETLRERMLQHKQAAAVYDEILALDPEHGAALRGLCAVGEAAGRTAAERVDALRRWVELCPDPMERLDVLESIVALAEAAALDDSEVAVLYEDILDLDQAHPQALGALEAFHRSNESWAQVAEILERIYETAGSADQPRVLERLLETQARDMQDEAAAEETLSRLAQTFPAHVLSPELLEEVLIAVGQPQRLVETLNAQADRALREEERADLLFRVGRVTADHLGDEAAAVSLMERALTQDPGHLGALGFLGDSYVSAEQWVEARPVLEALVLALDQVDGPVDSELRVEAWCRLAEVREKLGDDDRAAEAYGYVIGEDPQHLRASIGMGRIAWRDKEYDRAEELYTVALEQHTASLRADDRALIQATLGEIALARGDDAKSRELLERALLNNPSHLETLRELVALCERQGDWSGTAKYKRMLSDMMDDPLERFAALMELAQIYREQVRDDDTARMVLEEARELKPDSLAVPVKLLDVYLALGRYKQAVDVLHALIDREEDVKRQARYTYTLAVLFRDNLHDPRKAVAYLNETLDLDPFRLEAFEALDRILVKHKDWHGQAESYRAMLGRIEHRGHEDLEFRLLVNLARIYRAGLGQPAEALEMLRTALERQPDQFEVREQLASLLEEQDPGSLQALEQYRALLRESPGHVPAWKALGRLFARQRNRDAAWNVCGVLRLMGNADAKELGFYAKHQKPALALRKALGGQAAWESYLFDPSQDRLLGKLFALIGRVLGPQMATRTLTDLGLGPRDAVSLRRKSRFVSFLGTVSKILQVPIPAVYRSAQVRGIRKEPLWPPVMVVGPEMLTGRKGKELRFIIGKAMAYFLPDHVVAGCYPQGDLRTRLLAAMRSVMPEVSQGGEPGVRGVQKMLEASLRRRDLEQLRGMCVSLTERPTSPNLTEWVKQVERTANHAGHLLCNDLEVSVRMIKEERQNGHSWSKMTLQEAEEDLTRYVVSDEFLTLRREVGAAIVE